MKFRDIVDVLADRQEILVYNLTTGQLSMAPPVYLLKSKEVDGDADVALIMKDEIELQEGTGSSHYKKHSIIRVEVL